MNLQLIILGMIQGVTEFLPISSSGHLVLLQKIFDLKEMLFFDVLLHFSTLLAVIVLFFKEIVEYLKNLKIIFYIFILTIPTGIIGLLIKKYFSFVYDNVLISGIFLICTGVWLYLTETVYIKNSKKKIELEKLGILKSIFVGIAQGIAVLPGISRSGATLGSMLLINIEKTQAVKFIFISSIPAILGATFLELKDAISGGVKFQTGYIYGMIFSFIFGLLSLKFLINLVSKQKLRYFSYYCFVVGFFSIITYLFFITSSTNL